jgi:aryl-alcohol dehydrogenase-like predicted oxidoreductase
MGRVEDEVAVATVRAAIDSGITLIDTAQAYRSSERVLGVALKDGYRERCFLATKASRDFSPQGIRAAIEDSLRALNVEYVDLYQIHRWQPEYPVEESMETMACLQKEGKVRYIGVSNYDAGQMAQALRTARYHSNQVRYNLFDRGIEGEDAAFCGREGIGVLVHSPLAKGLLTGKYAPGHRFPEDDERSRFARFQGEAFDRYLAVAGKLEEVARDAGLSLVQLAIAWCLRLEPVSCVLVGAKDPDQVAGHLGAADARLAADDLARIEAILADAPWDA